MHTMYLILKTRFLDLRDDVVVYDCEDTSLVRVDDRIGFSPNADGSFDYATVLHALASGWRLLSQPQLCDEHYNWWLTNDGGPVMPPVSFQRSRG